MWTDLENEEQGVFIPGDDSSEPEWIEDEESKYYQRWMSQGEEQVHRNQIRLSPRGTLGKHV
jgi:hypothetical protein